MERLPGGNEFLAWKFRWKNHQKFRVKLARHRQHNRHETNTHTRAGRHAWSLALYASSPKLYSTAPSLLPTPRWHYLTSEQQLLFRRSFRRSSSVREGTSESTVLLSSWRLQRQVALQLHFQILGQKGRNSTMFYIINGYKTNKIAFRVITTTSAAAGT